MPIDEIVGAAAEMVVEAALNVAPEPPKRSRFWRLVYWSVVALLVGFIGFVIYVALS